jgi:hypothetical protein
MAHIQIRNVPPDLHRKLKIRAAEEGMTLSDYLLREVRVAAETPSLQEQIRKIRAGKLAKLETRAADLIREDRESR